MKFIVSFLFSILLVAPVCANYAPGNTNCSNESSTTCNSVGGCYWVPGDEYTPAKCKQCSSGNYNNGTFPDGCHTCNNSHPGWPTNTTGIVHPNGASSCDDWVCDIDNGYTWDPTTQTCTQCASTTYPSSNYHIVSGCDWACDADHYKDGNTCPACPNGTQTSGTDITGGIEACDYCSSGNLIITTTTRKCGICPSNSNYTTHTCECIYGAQASYDTAGFLASCTCNSPAVLNSEHTACECPDGYSTTITDGVVQCTPCLANQISQGGTCVCDEGYYGDASRCTACPSGTKVARTNNLLPTSSTQANCRAHSDTKFCDANGQNCMKLLQ